MKESQFQAMLIRELKAEYPGCLITKNDGGYLQGIPDLFIMYNDNWAALECKASESSSVQPNQAHYVDRLNAMSFAAFIYPENKEAVLYELQQTLRPRRSSRISER